MKERIGVGVAVGIWLVWAVLPGALLTTSAEHTQAFAAAQIGADSLSYLQGAPAALARYLIVAQGVVLPALIAYAWGLSGPPEGKEAPALAARRQLVTLLTFLGGWAALYWAGHVFMGVLDLHRGAAASVVFGYGYYLGLYGFLVTLPQWGWVLACRLAIRRSWLSALLAILGAALMAAVAIVLRARHLAWPTPALLRNDLFSGHADAVARAEHELLLWGATPVLGALAIGLIRTRLRREVVPVEAT